MSGFKAALLATFYTGMIVLVVYCSVIRSVPALMALMVILLCAVWRFLYTVFKS